MDNFSYPVNMCIYIITGRSIPLRVSSVNVTKSAGNR